MYAKIQITGKVEVITGMHIGGSSAFAAIGAVDSPVIRDPRRQLPLLPGSSLKGKMRSLLAKAYNDAVVAWGNDHERIRRVFGYSENKVSYPGRVIFSDMVIMNDKELRERGIQNLTEVKFENNINRQTAKADPRQIERVIPGVQFPLDLIYEVVAEEEIIDDIKLLVDGMKLLQYDYIGGHGTRGYGKIQFLELHADVVVGEIDEAIMEQVNRLF